MRRWRWAAVGGAVVLVTLILGAIGWYRWLPQHRPGLGDGERYGVDVSHHQGEIDWDAVAGDDIEFAYVKATEGGDFVDDDFARNWEGAGDAGLDRGAYHFFTLCRTGAEQAENFLGTVPADAEALPPVIDLELAGNCADRPSRSEVEQEVRAFIGEVEDATGQEVVLYVGADFEGRYHLRDELERPIWHRRLLRRPGLDGWWMWQFTDRARVDGIDGGVDLNVMRGEQPA
jgi:lysozyme